MKEKDQKEAAPRMVDTDTVEVLGLVELAERWRVTRQRVNQIASSERLPFWRELRCGRIWLLSDVEAFEKGWTRRTGVHVKKPKRT